MERSIMVCRIELRSLLLVFCLCTVAVGSSPANAHTVVGMTIQNSGQEDITGVTKKLQRMDTAMVGEAGSSKWLRGRKMQLGAEGALMEEEEVDAVEETGAGPSIGECRTSHEDEGKMEQVESDMTVERLIPSPTVKLAGHIPFSSDYHAPKTHPPKNN